MQRIRASVGDYYYDIHLDNGLTGRLGDRLSETLHPRRALLVVRSEEHTSELQSHSDLVCRLLLEKNFFF